MVEQGERKTSNDENDNNSRQGPINWAASANDVRRPTTTDEGINGRYQNKKKRRFDSWEGATHSERGEEGGIHNAQATRIFTTLGSIAGTFLCVRILDISCFLVLVCVLCFMTAFYYRLFWKYRRAVLIFLFKEDNRG